MTDKKINHKLSNSILAVKHAGKAITNCEEALFRYRKVETDIEEFLSSIDLDTYPDDILLAKQLLIEVRSKIQIANETLTKSQYLRSMQSIRVGQLSRIFFYHRRI